VSPDQISQQTQQKSKTPAGTIAGAVVGGVAGLALLALAAFLLLRRRRSSENGSTKSSRMRRNTSVLSRAGLISSAGAAEQEKSFDDNAYPQPPSQRHSVLFGPPPSQEADGESPVSPVGGVYENGTNDSRRNSRPLVYDQRLNPAALMQNWEMNGSRTSVNTMQDQRDYSRPLNVTNPDHYA